MTTTEAPWWIFALLAVFWAYLLDYLNNRRRGKSAQMLGPVRIEKDTPRYLRLLADCLALLLLGCSVYLMLVLLSRAGLLSF